LDLQSLLKLLLLLSEDGSFGYEEMMRMPANILLSLWNTKRDLKEERNKAEKKAYDDQSGGNQLQNMNPSSMMAQAKGMMPSIPNVGGMSVPSMGSFKR
jgi:hypothetical protein